MDSKKLTIVAVASALAAAPVAAQAAQDAPRGTGPGIVQYALGAVFAALLIYGIYDVLIEDDDDAQPVSP